MSNNKWRDKIETIWEAEEMCCLTMNYWERKFIRSIESQISRKGGDSVTWRQSKVINSIYSRIE